MKKITFYFAVFCTLILTAQNNSLQFDGSDDTVDLGENFAFEGADTFTIEAWIFLDNNNGIQQVLSKLGIRDGVFVGWGLQMTNGSLLSGYVSSDFNTDLVLVRGTLSLETDTWYHVAMTHSADNTISLFINGEVEPISSSVIVGSIDNLSVDAPARIGSYEGTGFPDEYFSGNIDELRVWDVVRTPTEIADNYNTELSGTEANLIGYYKMDIDNSSCDIQDCSVSQIQGTRIGTAGQNNLPQFSDNIPAIVDVACGSQTECELMAISDNAIVIFTLFPNPASKNVHIDATGFDVRKYTIYDILGSVINSEDVTKDFQSIDVSSLSKGAYFLKFINSENQQIVRKLIVE